MEEVGPDTRGFVYYLCADIDSAVASLLTREAALGAEVEALKFRSTNHCVTLQDSRPLDERLQVYARQFGNETIFSRTVASLLLEAHSALAERDALAAEVGALTSARDAYRTMLWQAEEDVKALREDAERWREVERRFNGSKTSAASMALEGLGLEPTPYRDFAETVDVARAEPGT